jgi:hypothetical protein
MDAILAPGPSSPVLAQAGEATVQGAVIDASGWVVGIGGLLLTALWLHHLYR